MRRWRLGKVMAMETAPSAPTQGSWNSASQALAMRMRRQLLRCMIARCNSCAVGFLCTGHMGRPLAFLARDV